MEDYDSLLDMSSGVEILVKDTQDISLATFSKNLIYKFGLSHAMKGAEGITSNLNENKHHNNLILLLLFTIVTMIVTTL